MNEMNSISFILGVELEVPFRLDKCSGLYRLSESNGIEKMILGERWVTGDKAMLTEILLGNLEILQPALMPSEKKIIRDYLEKFQIENKVADFSVSYSGSQPNMVYHLKVQWKVSNNEKPKGNIKSYYAYYEYKTDQRFFIGEIVKYPEGKMFKGLSRGFKYKLEELRLWDED